jgi:hypothetical protein
MKPSSTTDAWLKFSALSSSSVGGISMFSKSNYTAHARSLCQKIGGKFIDRAKGRQIFWLTFFCSPRKNHSGRNFSRDRKFSKFSMGNWSFDSSLLWRWNWWKMKAVNLLMMGKCLSKILDKRFSRYSRLKIDFNGV